MLPRVKKNKGYFGFMAADTAFNSGMAFATLSMLNLPVALVAAGINIAANIVQSYRASSTYDLPDDAEPAPKPKKSFKEKLKAFPKLVGNYYKTTLADPKFVVGTAAAGAGINIFFQAIAAIHGITTTGSVLFIGGLTGGLAVAGVAGCIVVAGAGVACMVMGNKEKWKGFRRYYDKTHRQGLIAQNALSADVPSTKRAKRANRFKHGLLVTASTESAAFSIAAAGTEIAARVGSMAAAPHTIPSQIPAMLVLAKWFLWPVWDVISGARLTARGIMSGKKPKDAIEDGLEAAVPNIDVDDMDDNEAFKKELGKPFEEAAKKKTAAKPQTQPTVTPKAAAKKSPKP